MIKLKFTALRLVWAFLLCLAGLFCLNNQKVYAQLDEPDVRPVDNPRTPLGAGFHDRIGVSAFVNNFGMGISGIYALAVAPYTEITFSAGITGIRDASSQEFITFFTGRKVVPNKYKRALGFPIKVGIEQRIFPQAIADNFRLFITASAGPAFAFIYPYFEDNDGNGYRTTQCVLAPNSTDCFDFSLAPGVQIREVFIEDKNSFFGGWGEGDWHLGLAGDISIGVDLGKDFNNQITFEIGYFFYYFGGGLQIMEPYRNTGFNELGVSTGQDSFFDPQEFFGTPQIKFTYSWW